MTVGYPFDKTNIDSQAGFIAVSIRNALSEAVRFKGLLDGLTLAEVQALGYTSDEATLLKDSFFELNLLHDVAHGATSVGGASDFFNKAKRLMGTN